MLTMEEALRHTDLRFAPGQIVKGIVIEVRTREVLVDIGYKSEGVVSASEFEDINVVKVGDEVPIYIEKLEDKDGMVVTSPDRYGHIALKKQIPISHTKPRQHQQAPVHSSPHGALFQQ